MSPLPKPTSQRNPGTNFLTTYALLAATEATALILVRLIWLALLALVMVTMADCVTSVVDTVFVQNRVHAFRMGHDLLHQHTTLTSLDILTPGLMSIRTALCATSLALTATVLRRAHAWKRSASTQI